MAKKGGRARKGPREGEEVQGYTAVTARFPADEARDLKAAVFVLGHPAWRILRDAFAAYLKGLPNGTRKKIRAVKSAMPDGESEP